MTLSQTDSVFDLKCCVFCASW